MPAGLPLDAETIRRNSIWFMVYGIALIVLGGAAIIVPGVATLAIEFLVAWLLVIGGALGLVAALSGGAAAPGFWWNLVTAILLLLAGLALLISPVAGAVTLTIILAAYLLAGGLAKILLAFRYRQDGGEAWGWLLASGVIDGVLGLLIAAGLPATGVWVIGLMVGINLVFTGVALVMAALTARRSVSGEAPGETA